ncbi:MAG: hypothetical protein IT207_05720 [Fimbriimonadaceae bacterium]|nr:hypothetical protein [Fimbriimonadaceae bacterium]
MDCYEIWVDLVPGTSDLGFVEAVHAWLGHIQATSGLARYRIKRRKLGFGPDFLGEWHISIEFEDLAQLDAAFHEAAARTPEVEALHAEVYRKVCNYRSGLWRDFPDKVRES